MGPKAQVDLDRIFERSIISAVRFIVGGAPILLAAAINNQSEIIGVVDLSPFVRTILRVLVFSYIVLAKANSAEDARPWASIMVSDPMSLQLENNIILLKRSPMWLTDA